jgi:aminomuconate-semialdehyde/2-hydroxymuconate-6-semialdehyde dehydrogenase
MLAKVLNEAGLPPGVCNIVTGIGPTTGKALVNHLDVPLISFTGGTTTGMHIARDAAPLFKKLYLELGGKNPNIIFEDADLEECVATTVRSSFSNQGEICLCGSRILVQESIYDTFVEKFVAATKKLVVGDPKDPKTNMGALISGEHRNRVEYFIEAARKDGGKILHGGDRPKFGNELDNGFFLNPTIITDLEPGCLVQQEEIFGPVVGISKFKTEAEGMYIAPLFLTCIQQLR